MIKKYLVLSFSLLSVNATTHPMVESISSGLNSAFRSGAFTTVLAAVHNVADQASNAVSSLGALIWTHKAAPRIEDVCGVVSLSDAVPEFNALTDLPEIGLSKDNEQDSQNRIPDSPEAQTQKVVCDQELKRVEESTDKNTFWDLYNACNHLPKYDPREAQTKETAVEAQEFQRVINEYFVLQKEQLGNQEQWIGEPFANFFDQKQRVFTPYVQKLVVPSEAKVAFHGDLHGDVHSLHEYIVYLQKKGYLDKNDPFKIIDPDFHMLFLGDYTDRGWYGAEVVYTILRLKIVNPDKVWLVRGNHEDEDICSANGFLGELVTKFSENNNGFRLFDKITRLYELLPVALYLGCNDDTLNKVNYLLCCHGGLELGFNPSCLLSSEKPVAYVPLGILERQTEIDKLPPYIKRPITRVVPQIELVNHEPTRVMSSFGTLGFMWSDFNVDPKALMRYSSGRGWSWSRAATTAVLRQQSNRHYAIRGVMRAHQHSADYSDPMMCRILNRDNLGARKDAGIGKLWITSEARQEPGKLWDGIVCTFCVTPCSVYGYGADFNYDAFGLLKLNNRFEDWHLDVHRVDMQSKMLTV